MVETQSINVLAEEEQFFSKPFYMSYSALNKLLYCPKLFYDWYVLKKREELLDSHLVEGKLTHCLLLEEDKFPEQFMVSPTKVPGDNARALLDKIYTYYKQEEAQGGTRLELREFEETVIQIMEEMNYFQNLKTDQQRIEKICTEENNNYFEFLKVREKKVIVDNETLQRCKDSVSVLTSNSKVRELLRLDGPFKDVAAYNEIHLQSEGEPFGLKGILDNVTVDYVNKRVRINDLKVISKSLDEFPDTVEYYRYWLQAAMYLAMVADNKGVLAIGPDFSYEFHFIVIDKYSQVYCFEVSEASKVKWMDGLGKVLATASYHFEKRNFTLPAKYLLDGVTL